MPPAGPPTAGASATATLGSGGRGPPGDPAPVAPARAPPGTDSPRCPASCPWSSRARPATRCSRADGEPVGLTPQPAQLTAGQHRLQLQTAWRVDRAPDVAER